MIIIICSVVIYHPSSSLSYCMDNKMTARATGDSLAAQLASRSLSFITLKIAAISLESDPSQHITVRKDEMSANSLNNSRES